MIGANDLEHIQNVQLGHLRQRGQLAVSPQGLCKRNGSVITDVVSRQAAWKTLNSN